MRLGMLHLIEETEMTTTTNIGTAAIRPATTADLPAIERLLEDSGLPTTGVADLVRTGTGTFFVAEIHDDHRQLVGVAGLEVCCNDALLRSVAVQPEWRSHGVGRELIHEIVTHAESRGIRALYLLTLTADRYFPRFGFEPVDRSSVPADVAETEEFKSVCCASAVTMKRSLA